MRTVDAPTIDSVALYDSVSGRRRGAARRQRLRDLRPRILEAYKGYEAQPTDVTTLAPLNLDALASRDLETNYDSFLRTHRDVRDQLFGAMPWGNCPSCGDRTATTLDHYLPKSVYEEFAVLPLNLVPACWECNTTKRAGVRDALGATYLHLYLDELNAGEQFLFADVTVDAGIPTIRYAVEPPASMLPELAARVGNHFASLRLAAYYGRKGLEETAVHAQHVRDELADGVSPDQIEDGLRRDAVHVSSLHGVNHWRHAGLMALADSRPFCSGACSEWIAV